jgi:hypothetical protein
MKALRTFLMAVDKTNIFMGKLMVGVTLLACSVITFEVVMRYLFNMPTNWGHETMVLLLPSSRRAGGMPTTTAPMSGWMSFIPLSQRQSSWTSSRRSFLLFVGVLYRLDFYLAPSTGSRGRPGPAGPDERSFTDWGRPLPGEVHHALRGLALLGDRLADRDIYFVARRKFTSIGIE